MKIDFSYYLACIFFILMRSFGHAQSNGINYSEYLRKSLENQDHFFTRFCAAEALLEQNFPIQTKSYFNAELEKPGFERIGALGLLALQNQKNQSIYDSLCHEILTQFKESLDDDVRLFALDRLAFLGFFSNDENIRESARNGAGAIKSAAQAVIANSQKQEDLSALAVLLDPADTAQLRYAAMALRMKEHLTDSVYLQMKKIFENFEATQPYQVYLASALWVHASEEDRKYYKNKLITHLKGDAYARREVYEGLSLKGDKEDLLLISDKFDHEDHELVKIAAAKAYLANEHYLQSKVGRLDWIILITYGLLLIGIGWFYSYSQKNKEDYFLGGRTVSPFVSGISMYVSFFSAISYLAVAGEVIKYGPVIAMVNILNAPIIYLLASYFLIPYFMNLKIISAYEILEKPLGNTVRKIASLIFVLTRLIWMALLIYLASKSMVVMMGWSGQYIIVITVVLGIITIIYTAMGGLKAVLLTDVIQFFILLFGALLTIVIIGINFRGFGSIIPTSWSENWSTIKFFDFDPYIRLTVFFAIINNITWWVCTTGADQMAIQRFVATKDLKSARKSFLITQMGQVSIILVLVLVGLSVMQFYQTSPNLLPPGTDFKNNADFLFPNFIANQLPTGMSGLVIAALFSASMSSLSSGINSVSSVLTTDIFHYSPEKKQSDSLSVIRITSGVTGVFVIFLSLIIPFIPGNIIEVTAKTNGLFIAPLFNLFFMALFVKKSKPFAVIMGSLYGLLTAFTIAFWDVLTGNASWSFLWIGFSSLLVSIAASYILSLIMPDVSDRKSGYWVFVLLIPWIIIYSIILI